MSSPEHPLTKYYLGLLSASGNVLSASLADPVQVSKAHEIVNDLNLWSGVLSSRPEMVVLQHTVQELQFGLFALLTGLYRHAFSSLRLALELSLLSIHCSTNRLELAEWQQGAFDTSWASLIGEEEGVLSVRYAKAFFPELTGVVHNFRNEGKTTYRELSQFVHGNQATWDLTPKNLAYNEDLQALWFDKLHAFSVIVTFALCLRFAAELDVNGTEKLSSSVLDRLGHIEAIRTSFGGVQGTKHE